MTLTINKKTYEAGELVAYVEKLEKENTELKAGYEVLSCSVGDFDKLQDKLEEEQRRNKELSDNLIKAKELLIGFVSKMKNSVYTPYEKDLIERAEQFLKEVLE